MIAAPFTFMIFAIIQLALHFMVQLTLDNATALAARQLRTGTVVADGATDTAAQTKFANSICSNMSWLQGQCAYGTTLVVDVRPLGSYSSAPGSPTINANGGSTNSCFYSGSAGSAVELRAYYRWQMVAPALISSLGGDSNGRAEIQATEVFQVEPDGQTNPSATQC